MASKLPEKKPHFIITLNWVDGVTLLGLWLSIVGILLAVNGAVDLAFSCLFVSMLLDAFDGVLARKYGTERPFGRYLDSFVDSAIYLVSPSVIFIVLGFTHWFNILTIFIFISSGVTRLSVFNDLGNVKKESKLYYHGLPVFWSLFVAAIFYIGTWYFSPKLLSYALCVILVVLSYFMLKNGQFYKPQNKLLMLSVIVVSSACFFALSLR